MLEDDFSICTDVYRVIYSEPCGTKVSVKVVQQIKVDYGSRYTFCEYVGGGLIDIETTVVVFEKAITKDSIIDAWDNGTYWLIEVDMDIGLGYLAIDSNMLEIVPNEIN